ncbi:MAG: hypothetical protein H0V24_08790 [Chloroflexia bacterium]|nr:hypothetical protein [Chloroflexia bacterium]MDQ3411921.1 hypothetical protein [Chloroflexota bacterium]
MSNKPFSSAAQDRGREAVTVELARRWLLALLLAVMQFGLPVSDVGIATTAASSAMLTEPEVITDCTVQPRRRRDLIDLAMATPGIARSLASGAEVAGPALPPAGVPADPGIVDSVTATAREMVACYNDGNLRRLFALYSEEYLFQVWGGFAGPNPSRAELEQTLDFISRPAPQPEASRLAFIAVEDVRELPDGDVSALVHLSSGSSRSVFAYSDGWYQLVWAHPVPGTEAPAP